MARAMQLIGWALALAALVALLWLFATLGRADPALAIPLLAPLILLPSPGRPIRLALWIGAGMGAGLLALAAARAGAMDLAMAIQALAAGAAAAGAWWVGRALASGPRGSLLRLGLALVWPVAGWAALEGAYRLPAAPPGPPPVVLLDTALPLDDVRPLAQGAAPGLDLDARPSATLTALRDFATVERPADLGTALDAVSPTAGGSPTLLLLHPPAYPPATLVAIDAFVRRGGRAVILADAELRWPLRHPLGDPRNPPPTTLLTPLIAHWGLTLTPTASESDRGERTLIRMAGQGGIAASDNAACRPLAEAPGLACRIGAGTAVVLADADWLHPVQWQGPRPAPGSAALRRSDALGVLRALIRPAIPATSHVWRPVWARAALRAGGSEGAMNGHSRQ